jgi:hypothetical protein
MKSLMNSRRLMGFISLAENHLSESLVRCSSESYCTALQQKKRTAVRYGSKADIAECETNVRFTPKSGH